MILLNELAHHSVFPRVINQRFVLNLFFTVSPSCYLNFQPFEVMSHYRDPQLQMVENYIYTLTCLIESCCLNTFHSQ